MKSLLLSLLLSLGVHKTDTQANQPAAVGNLLSSYIGLKNELVAGAQPAAVKQAAAFKEALAALTEKDLSPAGWKQFQSLKNSLIQQAASITGAKDLAQQRESFSALSLNFITLAKAVQLSDKPLYIDYCPMKKSYWISLESAIRNPYYGNAMLSCGSIKETLQ
ncbi:MAG: DUF3347 domain-containing protein [Chitinophagaceae bacterium]|jgi:hypothetical protein|nr:DUF3347 domain-containing protein [Chitinophagaceae bacterium]